MSERPLLLLLFNMDKSYLEWVESATNGDAELVLGMVTDVNVHVIDG